MTSLSVSMRLMTRASCETEWTWIVAVTTAVWSGVTPTCAATMLTLFSATTWVMSDSKPVRSYASTRMAIGYVSVGAGSHSTSMRRLTSRSLTTVLHVWRWTVTPLPRVMNPTMGSPGIGWQHFAKRTSRSPTPLTRTPPVLSTFWGGATVGSVLWTSSTTPSFITTLWAPPAPDARAARK